MTTVKFPPLTVEEAVDYLQANLLLNYDIQEDEAEDLSHSGNASEQVKAADIVLFSLPDDVKFQFGERPVV